MISEATPLPTEPQPLTLLQVLCIVPHTIKGYLIKVEVMRGSVVGSLHELIIVIDITCNKETERRGDGLPQLGQFMFYLVPLVSK